MKISIVLLTYQRPNILSKSVNTLLNNTKIKPEEFFILDDGSDFSIQKNILDFAQQNASSIPISVFLNNKNMGIGYQFEKAYNIMRMTESDIVCFIESDYIWRKGWLEDVLAVFEASPKTLAIAGCNHPDMIDKNKTHNEFCKLMIDQFAEDIDRSKLYAPFKLNTNRGNILVQGVSNSCGCQIVHWKRLNQLLKENNLESDYWKWMDRAFHKNNTGNRKHASDSHMSGTISYYGTKYQDLKENEFPFLDICDYSISNHICGGGINGMIVPEGSTFVGSPKWDPESLERDIRNYE